MAFAATRMILRDKRRNPQSLREDFPSKARNKHEGGNAGGSSGAKCNNGRNNQKSNKKGHNNQHDLIVTIDLKEHGLSEEQVADFKEAFMLIDKDEDGLITVPELATVMKSLGQRSTDKELRTLVREVSTDTLRSTVEFNEFLRLMSKKIKNDDCEEELLEAFRVFDKLGQGWIMSTDLRDVMKHLGERLSDPEVDDMLKEADRENKGRVHYQEFVQLLTK